jgi:hypothetical protein
VGAVGNCILRAWRHHSPFFTVIKGVKKGGALVALRREVEFRSINSSVITILISAETSKTKMNQLVVDQLLVFLEKKAIIANANSLTG